MRALVQLTLANTREFTRDRAALFWTFAFPLLFILIFGLVFGRDSGTQYEVGLVNEDSSPQASVLVETLRSTMRSTSRRAVSRRSLRAWRTAIAVL